jgi:aminopeptidase N
MSGRPAALRCRAVAAALSFAAFSLAAGAANLDLDVALDPTARVLAGSATLRFSEGEPTVFALAADAVMERATAGGQPVQLERVPKNGRAEFRLPASVGARDLIISYRLKLAPLDVARDHRGVLGGLPAMADAQGSFLPAGSGWYPEPEGDFSYAVTVSVPGSQRAIVPGRLVSEWEAVEVYRARFEFSHPSDGIDLMAGPYVVRERSARIGERDLRLRTYFGSDLGDALSDDYLAAVERYLRLYSDWIGDYPFDGFSVVASPLPTGFGMPTLTYLGAQVIRLPFIRDTSLGHEVLHNWWGNGVYPDYTQGNWAEGLTTFMADYAYKERAGRSAAQEMRHGWLRDYAALPEGTEKPLAAFSSRTHSASAAVGYGKAAMLFYMVREKIGAEAFDRAIRAFYRDYRFRRASWADLEAAFSRSSGQPLGPFFEHWLTRTGAPQLSIPSATPKRAGSKWDLFMMLAQGTPPYPLDVPLAISTTKGEKTVRVPLTQARGAATIRVQGKPLAVAVDPEFQIWRQLATVESPPIMREAIAARDPVIVNLDGSREFARAVEALANALLERPARRADSLPATAPVAILVGGPADIDAALAAYGIDARPEETKGRGTAQAWTVRRDSQTLLVISAKDAAALESLGRALPHLGGQSWAVFEGARPVARGVWKAEAARVPVRVSAGR